jgi:hypothetical protein
MIANHIHDALGQVRKMQELILAKRNFRGYSGTARAIGGIVAFAGSTFIYFLPVAHNPNSHLMVWGTVLCVSLVLNYGALFCWFLFDKKSEMNIQKLLPAIDALPALAVGAILTFALVMHHHYGLLFGVWMMLYGLVHITYRLSLPGENYIVGLFYIFCGTVCLFFFNDFYNPWPMGITFLVGEIVGGFIFRENRKNKVA